MKECEYCGNTFKNSSSMKLHQKTAKYCLALHNGISDEYICEYCDQHFNRKSILIEHQGKCVYKKISEKYQEKIDNLEFQVMELTRKNIDLDEKVKILQENLEKCQITEKPIVEPKHMLENPNYVVHPDGRIFSKISEKFLAPHLNGRYYWINLKINGKSKNLKIHRIVANLFCENPDNNPIVDHIDRNPQNNHYTNLRWATYKENSANCTVKRNCVKVKQCFLSGKIVLYNSMLEASEKTGDNKNMISEYCRGVRRSKIKCPNTNDLYYWTYAENKEKIDIPEDSIQIPNYPQYYVTRDGKIYSEYIKNFMKLTITDQGYVSIRLYKNGSKLFLVHRLVCELFSQNRPENYQELDVNHIDGNKSNNDISNLEYVTKRENSLHATRILGKNVKAVSMYNKNDIKNPIKTFASIKEAAEYIDPEQKNASTGIFRSIKTGRLSKGYIWRYADSPPELAKQSRRHSKEVKLQKITDPSVCLLFDSLKEVTKFLGRKNADNVSRQIKVHGQVGDYYADFVD